MRCTQLLLIAIVLSSCRADKASTGQVDSSIDDTDAVVDADEDQDGFSASEDCDDTDPLVHPYATELCDEIDNDCDDEIDEADAEDAPTWYLDSDGDGFGDESEALIQCDQPSGYVTTSKSGFDCDDSDPDFHPGADESDCEDPNDYNCDGSVAYADADADGWAACEECDDADPEVHPDALEICDELDNDCDGLTDDEDDDLDTGTANTWYLDADGDGYGEETESLLLCLAPSGYVEESAEGFDCNDDDDAYYPGADESDCADPNDYNCDGSVAYADADGDGWAACEECDDADSEVNPDATEICNEIDDDCDGDIDDDDSDVTETTTWFIDHDGDGYGSDDYTLSLCEIPAGYTEDDSDCDDNSADIHPDATEICNEIDDDCDGDIDDEDESLDSTTQSTWYSDTDGDGFGDSGDSSLSCDQISGTTADATDCDDNDADLNPDATEICNGIDDDCDGDIDDDDSDVSAADTWYIDYDGDGYGSETYSELACEAPSGWVDDSTDCDDTEAAVNPGATEICNEVDDDCDGDIDDDDGGITGQDTWYIDYDGDGYGSDDYTELACEAPSGWVADFTDCDDTAAAVNPGATESCNEIDDDCDGDIDDDDSDVTGLSSWYADADGDGYGDPDSSSTACEATEGYVSGDTDCDDTEAAVNPGATETCNEVDDDCDGDIDDDDSDVTGLSSWYADADGDGYGDPDSSSTSCEATSGYVSGDTDCDDTEAAVNPGATETCNEVDDDCDGDIDDDDSDVTGLSSWYADADGDGYGDPDSSSTSCEATTGWVSGDTDCDDTEAAANPGATEICNEVDDDCDGDIDDDDSDLSGSSTFYADADGDGYGDPDSSSAACEATTGWVSGDTDCDDTEASVNPGATESCNEVDDDCDGDIDEGLSESTWYVDTDGDGYGVDSSTIEACNEPSGYASNSSDCDDSDAAAYDDNGGSSSCAGTTCLDILDAGHSSGDTSYWIDPDGSGSVEVYCDMTDDDGGWTLVGVAIYGNEASSGWNDESSLNIGSSTVLNAHWHLSSDLMNSLAASHEYRAVCFDSSNNYTRYWWGVTDYNWTNLSSASESWDSYDKSGTSHAIYWAAHHYGLVSGANETDTLITAHVGNHWACGGLSAPGGEGYTGRGGNSSFRLWAK